MLRALFAYLSGAVLVATGVAARPASSPVPHGAEAPTVNGPLVVVDQRGVRGGMVQTGAGRDEILAVQGGTVRVLAGGLTATCCGLGGLAASPRGRYIAFSQESLYTSRGPIQTGGLWLMTAAGADLHRVALPPAAVRLTNPERNGEPLSVTAVSWSPDRYTLAYAVNIFTDTSVYPPFARDTGVWLARYDAPRPRLAFRLVPLTASATGLDRLCRGAVPTITALSWAPDGRTVAASTTCIVATPASTHTVDAIVAVDTVAGTGRVLITDARDTAYAPTGTGLAYVAGGGDGTGTMALRVRAAAGQPARTLATATAPREGLLSPAWSPDGRAIAYIAGSSSPRGTTVHVVDVATGRDRVVLADNGAGLPKGGYFVRLAWMHRPA